MSLFDILKEDAAKDKGSKKEPKKTGAVKSRKGRVKVYATIAKALEQGQVGQIFSTKGADRLYVVSHSVRTSLKHGVTKSKRLSKLYGPGAESKIKNSKKAVKNSKFKKGKAVGGK